MKSFLTKSFVVFLLIGLFSCSKSALRQNDTLQQINAVQSLNDPYLLSSILTQTATFYQTMNYSAENLPGAIQHMEVNFQGGSNTYQGFYSPGTDLYNAMSILEFIDSAIALSTARKSMSYVGIYTIFRVSLFDFMTAFYGDIYYSQALKGRQGILYPKYDKQADIYNGNSSIPNCPGLINELTTAAANIASGTDVINPTYDLMFGGDKTLWVKFANSLKLRLLMRESAKLSNVGAQLTATAALPVLAPTDPCAAIQYVGTNPVNSWIGGPNGYWGGIGSSEFDRRRPCRTMVDTLLHLNDPRAPIWFAPVEKPWTTNPALNGVSFSTTDPNGFSYTSTWEYLNRADTAGVAKFSSMIFDVDQTYVGFMAGMYGGSQTGNGNYDPNAGLTGNLKVSRFSLLFQQSSHPLLTAAVMNADEVQFLLAEAAAKGLISGSADGYYRAGITASMTRWGVPSGQIATYLAQQSISLPGDQAGQLAKIALQKWIALFMVADEEYLDMRRTQLPNFFSNGYLGALTGYQLPYPMRYMYPLAESGQNIAAYNAGVATLSPATDNQYAKMWLLQ